MALALVTKATVNNATDSPTAGATGVTTGSFTPSDNSILVAIAGGQNHDGGGSTLNVSGGGLTWTSRAVDSNATANDFISRIWTAPVTTGASMTVALTGSTYWASLVIIEFTGHDAASPIGATLAAHTGSRSGAYSPALSGASAADSYVVAGGYADSGTATKGAAWTEIYDFASISGGTDGEGNIEYIAGVVSVANWAALTSSFSTSATAIEIKAAAAGGGLLIPIAYHHYRTMHGA